MGVASQHSTLLPCAITIKIKINRRKYSKNHATHASTCLGATQVSVVARPYKDSFDSSARPMGVASQHSTLPCAISTFESRCLSLLLAMSSRVYLVFPPRGHEPPPTLGDHTVSIVSTHTPALNAVAFLSFPIHRYAKRPDVALYAIGLSTLSSSHPVLSALHPQGFRTRFALAAARRSFG